MIVVDKEEVEALIPHRPPFVQVDRLLAAGDSFFITELTVREDNLLLKQQALQETGMLEHIAQSAALGFGYEGKQKGIEPQVGYIGAMTRVQVYRLPLLGEKITTHVEVTHRLDPVVMVKGVCRNGEEKLLEGEIKLVLRNGE